MDQSTTLRTWGFGVRIPMGVQMKRIRIGREVYEKLQKLADVNDGFDNIEDAWECGEQGSIVLLGSKKGTIRHIQFLEANHDDWIKGCAYVPHVTAEELVKAYIEIDSKGFIAAAFALIQPYGWDLVQYERDWSRYFLGTDITSRFRGVPFLRFGTRGARALLCPKEKNPERRIKQIQLQVTK